MQTVLVADDERNDIEIVELLFRLSRIHNPIQTACNGDQVIDYLSGRGMYADRKKYPYPLLCLLDLRMPRRNGFEVLDWLDNHPEQTVNVIVLSALESANLQMTDRRQTYPCLDKPFNFLRFQEVIRCHRGLHLVEQDNGLVLTANAEGTEIFTPSTFASSTSAATAGV